MSVYCHDPQCIPFCLITEMDSVYFAIMRSVHFTHVTLVKCMHFAYHHFDEVCVTYLEFDKVTICTHFLNVREELLSGGRLLHESPGASMKWGCANLAQICAVTIEPNRCNLTSLLLFLCWCACVRECVCESERETACKKRRLTTPPHSINWLPCKPGLCHSVQK